MSNDELAALVLPWAKEHHADKYAQTLKVAGIAETFRRYLLRLVEIRCESSSDFLRSLPVTLLDETSLVRCVRTRHDTRMLVRGQRTSDAQLAAAQAKYGTTVVSEWWLLAIGKQDYDLLTSAITALDLEPVR